MKISPSITSRFIFTVITILSFTSVSFAQIDIVKIFPFDETYLSSYRSTVIFPNNKIIYIDYAHLKCKDTFSVGQHIIYLFTGYPCTECDATSRYFLFNPNQHKNNSVINIEESHCVLFPLCKYNEYSDSKLMREFEKYKSKGLSLEEFKTFITNLQDENYPNLKMIQEEAKMSIDEFESICFEEASVYYGEIFTNVFGIVYYNKVYDKSNSHYSSNPFKENYSSELITIDPKTGSQIKSKYSDLLIRRKEAEYMNKINKCKRINTEQGRPGVYFNIDKY